ncbi:MAG: hypothetical protein MUP80_00880, partial [Acidobacteriia bacterium]|nr:hypothetical protein [Terriglobia bacterium]
IGSITKSISYAYNLDGSVASVTYPSGRVISYDVTGAGRPNYAKDLANGINYALSTTYAPQGAVSSALEGQSGGFGGITWSASYNNRLLPTSFAATSTNGTALNLAFSYFANGNVSAVTNNRDTSRTQTFTYDNLDRLATGQSQATSGGNCWGHSFGYDRYANLTSISVTKCSAPMLSLSVNTQNRITNSGFTYDNAGNMTSDGVSSYSWNAENRLTSTAGVTYTYDGDGRRVEKSNEKLFWYGVNGEELFETDLSGNLIAEYIYLSGRVIARRDAAGAVYYFFADHLGSLRVITNATGQIQRDADFYPYGGERLVSGTLDDPHKFAGMEYESESGLYRTLYRQYSPTLGRWLSADPLGNCSGSCGGGTKSIFSVMPDFGETLGCTGSCGQAGALASPVRIGSGQHACTSNPQSLNLYAYVLNNPANLADPSGGYTLPACFFPNCSLARRGNWGLPLCFACYTCCLNMSGRSFGDCMRRCFFLPSWWWWWWPCVWNCVSHLYANISYCSYNFARCLTGTSGSGRVYVACCYPPPF